MMGLYIGSATIISLTGLYAYNLYRQEMRMQETERRMTAAQEKFINK